MQSGSTPTVDTNYNDILEPTGEDLSYQIQQLVQQGALSPEMAETILANPSAFNDIVTDPALMGAQMDALTSLQDIADQGGMTLTDKANLQAIKNEENSAARGAREAILQNAQARGMGGSGMEIMAQLQNAQDAASRRATSDLTVNAQAQQRALEALQQAGTQAGNIQNTQFNQAAQVAAANDAISKFNAQNQQSVQNANIAARNDAAAKNLAAKQSVADSNAQLQTTQNQQKAAIAQQQFENAMKKRNAQYGVESQNAATQGANSAANAASTNQTIGTGLTAAAMFMSDEREKKDIEEFDAGAFLDSLSPKKYRYKNPANGQGDQAGVMAQDLEKTKEGSGAVVNTLNGKMVDSGKASNLALASVADLHKRLKKLEGEE